MVDYSNALAWIVISPVAVLTDIIAIIVIIHYYPFFHGTDVMMMSLMVAMAANALLVLPIPAFLELKNLQWNESLCSAYVWCFITFRVSQTLSLMAMSIHWSTVLKLSAEKHNCFSTKALKIATVFIWTISATIGLLPLIGAAGDDYNKQNVCKFLGFNLGVGFAIFFLIFNIAAMFICVICTSDATFLIKHMKRVAEVKYQAGRFHLPDKRAAVPSHGTSSINEKYNRLTFAWDLSKLVLIFSSTSFLLNHFPFAIIQGAQVFADPDRETLEVVVLWLAGVEALLLPHSLWVVSRRYRHALTYVWKVHVLRRNDVEEEDPYACMLQSYTRRERGKPRPPSVLGQNGGASASGTLRSTTSEHRRKEYAHTNGQMGKDARITAISDRDDYETIPGSVRKHNGIIHGEVHVENHADTNYNERAVDAFDFEIIDTPPPQQRSTTSDVHDSGPLRRISEASSSSASHSSNKGAFLNREDVKRSSSNNSRKEWKDQMKKKHLPPIFVNEAFDSEEQKAREKRRAEARETLYTSAPADNLSNSSLHYYMSSDYHPDYLIDSLPRRTLAETHGIDHDGSVTSSDKSSMKGKRKDSLGCEIPLTELRPYLSTFKVASMLDRNESFKSDVSNTSDMKEDSEIVFDVGALPLDEIDDGINTPKPMSTNLRIDSLDQWRHIQRTSSRTSSFGSGTSSSKSSASIPRNAHNVNRVFERNMAESPVYTISGIVEASTSFGRGDQKENKNIASTNNADRDMLSTGSFKVSSLSSSQSSSDSIFVTNSKPVFEQTSDAGDEMPESSGSNNSVTLSPIKGEVWRRPWMDEFVDDAVTLQMQTPLFNESDTDTLKDEHDDNEMKNVSYDSRNSELSTPVSSIFDEETDRGFEEALDMNSNIGGSVYGGVGLCFESIMEEPEDLTSSGSNPFLDEISGDEFRTQAVVSKRSDSRTSSSTSPSDNQLSYSPDKGDVDLTFTARTDTPVIVATDTDYDFGDSGFTSGMDNINVSDCSNRPEVHASGKLSPWPDTDEQNKDINMSFESDFSDMSKFEQHEQISKPSPQTSTAYGFQRTVPLTTTTPTTTTTSTGSFQRVPERHSLGNRKPSNKAVNEIRTRIKQAPSRVISLDKPSPEAPRKLPKRGRSVDDIEMDIQPAYF